MATQNLGRVKIVWKGDYSSNTAYVVDDAVFYEGSSYICKQNATAKIPTNTNYWDKMASRGNSGAVPAIGMSATVDGTSSATPSVTVTEGGTALQPTFELAFSGLKGAKGDKGDKGDTGASGDLAWDDVNKSVQKNLLKNNMVNHAKNNVTFTVANNKEISLSGTSTGDITAGNDNGTIGSVADLPYGTYRLSGCPENGSGSTYRLLIQNKAGTAWVTDTGSGAEFTVDSNSTWDLVYIRANSGVNLTGKVFKPMIRKASIADSTYEPYIPNNTELFPRSEQAVLGAVNLNLLDLATIKSLNTTGTWSGNAYTENSVTFTIGDDLSIDIDGTPSASTTLRLSSGASAKAGSYIWGSTDNPVNNKIYLTAQIGSTNYDAVFSAKEVPVVLANDVSNLQTRVYVGSGTQFDHVKVYPMLSLNGGSYVTPAMTNKELTEQLNAIFAESLNDGTTFNIPYKRKSDDRNTSGLIVMSGGLYHYFIRPSAQSNTVDVNKILDSNASRSATATFANDVLTVTFNAAVPGGITLLTGNKA